MWFRFSDWLIVFTFLFFGLICSKILSLVASFFAAAYVTKWKEFFPQRKLEYAPSFTSKVVTCATPEVLQVYLAWRQQNCKTLWPQKNYWYLLFLGAYSSFCFFFVTGHAKNQYETCFWMLVKSGKTISETQEVLKVCCCCFSVTDINVLCRGMCLASWLYGSTTFFAWFFISYYVPLFDHTICLFSLVTAGYTKAAEKWASLSEIWYQLQDSSWIVSPRIMSFQNKGDSLYFLLQIIYTALLCLFLICDVLFRTRPSSYNL